MTAGIFGWRTHSTHTGGGGSGALSDIITAAGGASKPCGVGFTLTAAFGPQYQLVQKIILFPSDKKVHA